MDSGRILTIVIKTFVIVLVFIYVLIGVLISRQVFLMNKAIKTKLAGCLNLVSLIHIIMIIALFVYIIFA